jgi:hypothetical protein
MNEFVNLAKVYLGNGGADLLGLSMRLSRPPAGCCRRNTSPRSGTARAAYHGHITDVCCQLKGRLRARLDRQRKIGTAAEWIAAALTLCGRSGWPQCA